MNIIQNADIHPSAILINSEVGNNCMIADGARLCYSKLGDFSYISRNSNVFSSKIEKFTSISWNVSIGPAIHDYNKMSQHSMLFASRFGMIEKGEELYNQYPKDVYIGNDVWIGCNAVIMRGVRLGDGCVIGANSIITKDVQPYSIVIGKNQILKDRFSPLIISLLLELKWWNMEYDFLKANLKLFEKTSVDNINKLIENYKKYKNV